MITMINLIFALFSQSGSTTLAYRPFIDPLKLDDYWLILLVPLVFAISLTYKTIKTDDLSKLPGQALYLTAQIVVFMILAASALWLLGVLV
ncbi:MAG: hypothetical protein WD768_19600 [Phycisphaeraceae bacterium]